MLSNPCGLHPRYLGLVPSSPSWATKIRPQTQLKPMVPWCPSCSILATRGRRSSDGVADTRDRSELTQGCLADDPFCITSDLVNLLPVDDF